MYKFYLKRGDTSNDLQVTLTDDDGTAVDVTGATIVFNMKHVNSNTLKVNRGAVTLVTPASGIVKYVWSAANVNVAGKYRGEFEVTYANAKVQTFPNDSELMIEIRDDLG